MKEESMASQAANQNVSNRWLIATAGVVMQVALGAVYAWSVFRVPLSDAYGTGVSAVNTTFSIAILALGFAAFFGGLWMNSSGPRVVARTSGVLYGAGIFLASFASPDAGGLWTLYFTYGLMAGIGIGLGYIVPVATLIRWFPDKRGFITGIAVAGFGAGALVTAPLAKQLVQGVGLFPTFAILSEADPIAQEVSGVAPATAAWLVSIISVGNAAGRFLWAWLSDALGRKWVFLVMFLLQAVLFFLLPVVGASFVMLAILSFIIVSCYGGGSGTMPAFNADYFRSKNVGMIYGLMITAWGFGGVLGPLLISIIYDMTSSYAGAFYILAGIMLASSIIPFITRPPSNALQAADRGVQEEAGA